MVNIVACIKHVPGEKEVHVSRRTGKPVFDPAKLRMGRLSRRALEVGLRLVENTPNSTLTAVTVGDVTADPMLREALAMGADRAVRLADKVLDDADDLGIARALAAAVNQIGDVDLVVTGARTKDRYAGQVGPQMAAILDHGLVTYVSDVELDGDALKVTKTLQGPDVAHIELDLPAVLTIGERHPRGRRPTTWGIRAAYDKEIDVWGLGDIGLAVDTVGPSASVTVLQKVEKRPDRERAGETLTGDPDELATTLVRRLKARGLVR